MNAIYLTEEAAMKYEEWWFVFARKKNKKTKTACIENDVNGLLPLSSRIVEHNTAAKWISC